MEQADTLTWFGVRLQEAGDTKRKQWSLYLCQNGMLIRHWGPAHSASAGGTFKGSKHALGVAKSEVRALIDSKTNGPSNYRVTEPPVLFTAPASVTQTQVAAAYREAAKAAAAGASWQSALQALTAGTVAAPPAPATPATPPAPAALLAPEEKAYERPNGEHYYPRRIAGLHDVALLRTAAKRKENVLLYGPPGCGKTALAEAAHPDSVTVNGNSSMEAGDLIGRWLPAEGGGYMWRDGPVIQAAEAGLALFIDEIARIDTQVLSIIFPLMDGRGWISVDERPASVGAQRIVAADGFCVIAAFNPYDGPGTQMGEALWSRFTHKIEYTTDHTLCRALKVPARAIKAAVKLDSMLRDDATSWAPQTRELLRFKDIAAQYGEDYAADNLVAEAPFDARDTVASVVRDIFANPNIAALVTRGRA